MKVIGIDPGYDRVGVAIVEKSKETGWREQLIYSECIITDRSNSMHQRIFTAGFRVKQLVKEYKPHVLAIEKIFFAKNQKTAIDVAAAKGVFEYIASEAGLSVHGFSPPSIKLAVAGHGKATKKDVLAMVPRLITIDIAQKTAKAGGISGGLDDELDAIAVALTYLAHHPPTY
jgi:crossover junction endodeoxyribonuclease RuvC